jgi:dolichyl-phosphate beta-glucosyltransferase
MLRDGGTIPYRSPPVAAETRPTLGIGLATLSLVIPAYNEQARLPGLLATLATTAETAVTRAGFELLEVAIVDDGSADDSRRLLSEATLPKLRPVLDHEENRGKGAAVADGVRRARGDYVLLADVDLSTPLEELGKLAGALDGDADIAIGSRGVAGAVVERGPRHRKLTGSAFSAAVRMLTGVKVRDTQNGFKLLPADAAKRLFAEQICPGFAFDVELLVRAEMAGLRIAEVPVLYIHDSRSRVQVASASPQMLREVAALAARIKPRRAARRARAAAPRRWLADLPADDSD